ncbi:ribosome small subunit-dependent GTPase A [uncultured Limosilactobacillus sp.]|uniref:ribosome small subunit-dependent GTPase A n=1 Tax=uncultured Limosilactobacillus sp. TaxID=2837629 RepID=UPI0025EE5B42|nr:ribosome small subunit-dependent GTPase A [uncultured Limosilactobacillus sp.]
MKEGIIQQSLSGFYDIIADNKIYRTRGRGNFRKRGIKPLVGDHVRFADGYLLEIQPRKNQLVRPLVANVDTAVVVTAATNPQFSSNLLDRQLIALEAQAITPIIYFSKVDLLDLGTFQKLFATVTGYQKIGYTVYYDQEPYCQTNLERLSQQLSHQVVTMMGQTGAGKSTLLNHLSPKLDLPTGEVSKALKRGKHTTRKVALLQIGDALVADTPGFSSYEDFQMTKEELPQLFPEMQRLAQECKFRGCLHLQEPGCAVKNAVENGKILESRYDNYVQFQELIKNQKPKY